MGILIFMACVVLAPAFIRVVFGMFVFAIALLVSVFNSHS